MAEHSIAIEENPRLEDIRLLYSELHKYNVGRTNLPGDLIDVFLRDSDNEVLGGAHGWTGWNWLHVDALWLREDARHKGYGTRIMLATEAEALRRGCRHAELETFSFQARGFYEKLGYRVFAELDDFADVHKWYFLKKDLLDPQ